MEPRKGTVVDKWLSPLSRICECARTFVSNMMPVSDRRSTPVQIVDIILAVRELFERPAVTIRDRIACRQRGVVFDFVPDA